MTLPKSVSEIVPGMLYAIGGCLPADIPFSIFPRGFSGFLPIQCYAWCNGGDMLIIDTGIGCHIAQILEGLDYVRELHKPKRIRLLFSRRESDNIINFPVINERYPLEAVYCFGDIDPYDFFIVFDNASAESIIQSTSGRKLEVINASKEFTIGDLHINLVRTTLKLLTTFWVYEPVSKTMLTSDTFAFLTQEQDGPVAITRSTDGMNVDAMMKYLEVKFDWLIETDTSELVRDMQRIADSYEIHRLCPCMGQIIEGTEAVKNAFATAIQALKQMQKTKRVSQLTGLDLRKLSA